MSGLSDQSVPCLHVRCEFNLSALDRTFACRGEPKLPATLPRSKSTSTFRQSKQLIKTIGVYH
jgi:hypothetical protein